MQCGGNGGGVLLLPCERVWAPGDSQPLGLGAGEAQARGAPGCSVWRLLEKAAPSQPVGQAPGWPPDPPPRLAPPSHGAGKGGAATLPTPAEPQPWPGAQLPLKPHFSQSRHCAQITCTGYICWPVC